MHDERLLGLITRIGLPPGVAWGVAGPGEGGLWPEEAAAMVRARPQRRSEFAAGRCAARAAMARLGLRGAPIPMGADRAPVWPDGVVGSISHSAGLCLAIVARADTCRGIGVDLEADGPLDSGLIGEICRDEELTGLPPEVLAVQAKRLFSAKEAAYKAHYPLARRFFGFHALSVDLEKGYARFTDHPDVAAFPPESRTALPLRQVTGGGLVLSLSLLPAQSTRP